MALICTNIAKYKNFQRFILRVLKLVTTLPKLQVLVSCLLKCLPSMFYVSMLLGLLFLHLRSDGGISLQRKRPHSPS